MLNPGLYPNIPFNEYKVIAAVSNSYLGRLDKCPAKALIDQEDTPSMLIGRAVHKLVLEGEEAFLTEFIKTPKIDKRTKEGKAEWATFQEKHSTFGSVTLLDSDDYEKVFAIKEAVYAHPWAAKILAENVTEQTVIWQDRDTELLCKARPDAVPDKDKMSLIDLKSTVDASEAAFTRSIIKYGYARQAAFYLDGYGVATGVYSDSFIHIAVETEPPYRTEIYLIDDEFIAWGRQEYRRLLAIEKECREKGQYPHYSRPYTTINKPVWL